MNRIAWFAAAIGSVVVACVGLTALGVHRWKVSTRALLGRLDQAQQPPISVRDDIRELDGLPAPVQRYFRPVLKDGQPIVSAVTIEQAGSINLSPSGEQWRAFTARLELERACRTLRHPMMRVSASAQGA